ncbi:hypothetical protein DSECCO2_604530 [anaerobic digester metagenome]
MHQPSFIRVHRLKQSAPAALFYLFCGLERHSDQLLLVTHAIVFTIDDHFQIRVDLTGEHIGQQLDGIKILTLAADDDTGVVTLNIQAELAGLAEGDGYLALISHLLKNGCNEQQKLVLKVAVDRSIKLILILRTLYFVTLFRNIVFIFKVNSDLYIAFLEQSLADRLDDFHIEIFPFNVQFFYCLCNSFLLGTSFEFFHHIATPFGGPGPPDNISCGN